MNFLCLKSVDFSHIKMILTSTIDISFRKKEILIQNCYLPWWDLKLYVHRLNFVAISDLSEFERGVILFMQSTSIVINVLVLTLCFFFLKISSRNNFDGREKAVYKIFVLDNPVLFACSKLLTIHHEHVLVYRYVTVFSIIICRAIFRRGIFRRPSHVNRHCGPC